MKYTRTFVVAILAIALLVPLSGCGEQRSASERLESAYNDYQAGKYRAAFIELKNLLQTDPGYKDARLLLGMTSLKMGDAPSAGKELERARDLGASPDEYYVPWMQARLVQGAHKEIVDEFDLTGMEDQEKRQIAKVLYGNALFGDGQVSAAEGEYRAVINSATAMEPLRRAYLGLADIARSKGDVKDGIAMASKAVEYDKDSPESAVVLGQLLLSDGQFESAREQFARVRESTVASSNDRFIASGGEVEAALKLGDIDEAKRAANRLFGLSPGHPITGYLLGRVAYTAGDKAAAYDHLQGVLSKYPQFRPAQTLQGALSLERKEFEQAEMFLSSVVAAQPGNLEARKLLAETRLQMYKPESAAQVLQEGIDAGFGDQQMISMLGRASMQQGNKSVAIEQLEKSLAANPGNPNLQIALAAAYLTDGQAARAIEIIKSGADGAADSVRGALLLLLAAVQEKNDVEARKQAEVISARWPDDAQANNLVGGWYFSKGEYDKARQYFDAILEDNPNDINALTNLGRIDLQMKNYAQARNRYVEFLKREPNNQAGMLSLAYVYQAEGDSDNSFKMVEQAHKNDPSAEVPAIILSRFYLLNRDFEKSLELASTAAAANPQSVAAQMAKGTAHLRTGDSAGALAAFKAAYKIAPDNKTVLHAKAQAELQERLFAQARETYEQIWSADPDDLQAARNLIVLEIRAGRGTRAEEIMKSLQASGKDQAVVVEIEGDMHRENKNTAKALAAYDKAYKASPSRSVALKSHRLLNAENAEADAPLRDWLAKSPEDFGVRVLLAQYYQKTNKNSEAIDQYEKVMEQRSDNPLVLNNLAWMYFEQGGGDYNAKAQDLSRRAMELDPASPQIVDTYGWILFRTGKIEEGLKILAEAEAMAMRIGSSSLNDITYHHAVALNESGDRAAARSRLQKILGGNENFATRDDARMLLDSLQR